MIFPPRPDDPIFLIVGYIFALAICISILYHRYRTSDHISKLRQQLNRAFAALGRTVDALHRSDPMVQGSFYRLRRKCGKPNCRCASGHLHASWVLTRSEEGKDRLYSVPQEQRAQIRKEAAAYRRYQRARALLGKRHAQILALADEIAQHRLRVWPAKKKEPPP